MQNHFKAQVGQEAGKMNIGLWNGIVHMQLGLI